VSETLQRILLIVRTRTFPFMTSLSFVAVYINPD
jgi:hypothetical protein